MTEQALRQKVIDQFKAWLGWSEASGKHRKIVDLYNSIRPLPVGYMLKYTDSWCAATVSAVGQALGITDTILPECSCPRMIELYSRRGLWMEDDAYVPKVADIIMYDWQDNGIGDNRGTPDHVGMVAEVNGNTLKVIEGNISNSVAYRTLQIGSKYIRGYCIPAYAEKAAELEGGADMTYDEFKSFMAQYEKEFADNDAGSWSKEDREWAIQVGLFQGSGTLPDGTPNYMWQSTPTREQIAAILHRFAKSIGKA